MQTQFSQALNCNDMSRKAKKLGIAVLKAIWVFAVDKNRNS